MRWLGSTRSLLLTGLADVWSMLREDSRRGGEAAGLALMVVSAAAFAAMAAFAKWLLPHTPTQAVVLSRGAMMTAIFLAAARWQGVPVIGRDPVWLLLRGLLGYTALSCYFWSVQHLPLGDAVLLQYSHPVFVAALAPLLLRERTPGRDWGLILIALAGVALVVRPAGTVRVEALVGVVGSLFSGLAYLAVRRLSRTEHSLTILIWFPLATIPLSLLASLRAGAAAWPTTGTEVVGHLLVTASALVGQLALTHGLARVGAARATAVTLTGPVFGLAFDALLFERWPAPASVAGTGLVLGSLVLLGRRAAGRGAAPAAGGAPRPRAARAPGGGHNPGA